MSSQQVTELRKAGRLAEADSLARQLLAADASIWNRRAMAWVLYEQLKAPEAWQSPDRAVRPLEDIGGLALPPEETLFWEVLPFGIGKLVGHLPADAAAAGRLDAVFASLMDFPIRKPGNAGSFLVRSFLRAGKTWPRFPDFLAWWGPDAFVPDDFIPPVLPNERRGIALVEQVLIGLARHLLTEDGGHPAGTKPDADRILAWLPTYDRLAQERPEFRYIPYYRSKLLSAAGRPEQARRALLPFAWQKSGEYWVWDLLGELYEEHPDLRFACLCRALVCRMDPKFSVKVRRKAVPLLLARGAAAEAAAQVRLVAQVYEEEGWKLPREVGEWRRSDWYAGQGAAASDPAYLRRQAEAAEALLQEDLPESVLLVTGLNPDKHVLYFIDAAGGQGFARHKRLPGQFETGVVYRVRLEGAETRLTVRAAVRLPAAEVPDTLVKPFRGVFRPSGQLPFGFVGAVFVPPAMVVAQNLTGGMTVEGQAVRTWDRKKSTLGWRASILRPVSQTDEQTQTN